MATKKPGASVRRKLYPWEIKAQRAVWEALNGWFRRRGFECSVTDLWEVTYE